jgi:hypothetical protein
MCCAHWPFPKSKSPATMDAGTAYGSCPTGHWKMSSTAWSLPLSISVKRKVSKPNFEQQSLAATRAHTTELPEHFMAEEGEPDTLALARNADPAHAVVPVARANQRQAMHAGVPGHIAKAAMTGRSCGQLEKMASFEIFSRGRDGPPGPPHRGNRRAFSNSNSNSSAGSG